MRYRALYGEGTKIVEVEIHKPKAPSRAGMTESRTGREWERTETGERAATKAVREWNQAEARAMVNARCWIA